jgi:hypothetical protein
MMFNAFCHFAGKPTRLQYYGGPKSPMYPDSDIASSKWIAWIQHRPDSPEWGWEHLARNNDGKLNDRDHSWRGYCDIENCYQDLLFQLLTESPCRQPAPRVLAARICVMRTSPTRVSTGLYLRSTSGSHLDFRPRAGRDLVVEDIKPVVVGQERRGVAAGPRRQ